MQRQSVIREEICLAAMEVAVERAPRFRRDFFNSLPRWSERTRSGRNLPPNPPHRRPELVAASEQVYPVRMKEIG
jgi:hypothetical protein